MEKKMDHCVECGEYPCQLFSAIMCNPKIQQVLPHSKIAVKNLDRIKEVGANQWLAEQDQQWQCPGCQTRFSWYAETCANCGRDLADQKDYNNV